MVLTPVWPGTAVPAEKMAEVTEETYQLGLEATQGAAEAAPRAGPVAVVVRLESVVAWALAAKARGGRREVAFPPPAEVTQAPAALRQQQMAPLPMDVAVLSAAMQRVRLSKSQRSC